MKTEAVQQFSFRRAWAMPSSNTFSIKPIGDLLRHWLKPGWSVIDPFARDSKFGTLTNDLNPATNAGSHQDARAFIFGLPDNCADAALMDPPYSPRQISECYQSIGMPVTMRDTQHPRMIGAAKDALVSKVKTGGIVVCCGWNSQGMGKGRGFNLLAILLVAHGGSHNDTIVTVEEKRC